MQKGSITANDIQIALKNKTYSELELENIIGINLLKVTDTIFIDNSTKRLFVSKFKNKNGTFIIYLNNDLVKILVYNSGVKLHDEKVWILKNNKYLSTIYSLIKDEDLSYRD